MIGYRKRLAITLMTVTVTQGWWAKNGIFALRASHSAWQVQFINQMRSPYISSQQLSTNGLSLSAFQLCQIFKLSHLTDWHTDNRWTELWQLAASKKKSAEWKSHFYEHELDECSSLPFRAHWWNESASCHAYQESCPVARYWPKWPSFHIEKIFGANEADKGQHITQDHSQLAICQTFLQLYFMFKHLRLSLNTIVLWW